MSSPLGTRFIMSLTLSFCATSIVIVLDPSILTKIWTVLQLFPLSFLRPSSASLLLALLGTSTQPVTSSSTCPGTIAISPFLIFLPSRPPFLIPLRSSAPFSSSRSSSPFISPSPLFSAHSSSLLSLLSLLTLLDVLATVPLLLATLALYDVTVHNVCVLSFRSVRGCKRTKIMTGHWRQTPFEQLGKKYRARAPAWLPTTPTYDSWQIRDGADHNSRYQRLFSPFARGETCHRISHLPKLARISGRGKLGCGRRWWNRELGFAGSLLKSVPPWNLSPIKTKVRLGWPLLSWGMSMQYTRSNMHERSSLTRLPAHKDDGDLQIDDLVIFSGLHCSDVHVGSLPIEVQPVDAFYDFLQIPTNAGKWGSTLAGEFWGGRLDGVSGTLGFPSCTPSLTHAHLDAGRYWGLFWETWHSLSHSGESTRQSRCVLHCCHHYAAKQTMPRERSCSSQDSLLCWKRKGGTLRTAPRHGYVSEWRWLTTASRPLHGRLDSSCTSWPRRKVNTCAFIGKTMFTKQHAWWKHSRCTSGLQLSWATLFSYRLFESKHIHSRNQTSPDGSHVKKHGHDNSWFFSIRAWHYELSRRDTRAHEQLLSSKTEILVPRVWHLPGVSIGRCPSTSESWYTSLSNLLPSPTAVFASVQSLSELDPLREPLSVTFHGTGDYLRKLESSCSVLKVEPVYVEENAVKRKKKDGIVDVISTSWPRFHRAELGQCSVWTRSVRETRPKYRRIE